MVMFGYAIGVDLGGTNLRVAAVDDSGRMLEKRSSATSELGGSEGVVVRMCEHIADLTAKFKGAGALHGIGIAIPGIIDLNSGIVCESPNLPGWHDYPVREEIERRLGTRVILENDANAAAMGEFWIGAAREYDSACMLTLGTGVGGGVIIKGALWHGVHGMAGEPGHATIDPEGPLCPCGNRGCLEQFAGATAIVRAAREIADAGKAPAIRRVIDSGAKLTSRDVYELAAAGDEPSRHIFERAGRALGIALAASINMLNLPIYVVGGGGSGAWDVLSPFIHEEVRSRSFVYRASSASGTAAAKRAPTIVCRAALGPDAGMYGAARLPMLPEEVYEHSLHQGTPAMISAGAKH